MSWCRFAGNDAERKTDELSLLERTCNVNEYRETETDRQTQTDRHRQTERQSERQRDQTERERERTTTKVLGNSGASVLVLFSCFQDAVLSTDRCSSDGMVFAEQKIALKQHARPRCMQEAISVVREIVHIDVLRVS